MRRLRGVILEGEEIEGGHFGEVRRLRGPPQGRPQDFFRGGPDFFLRGTNRFMGLRVKQFLNASQQNTLLLSKCHFMARI